MVLKSVSSSNGNTLTGNITAVSTSTQISGISYSLHLRPSVPGITSRRSRRRLGIYHHPYLIADPHFQRARVARLRRGNVRPYLVADPVLKRAGRYGISHQLTATVSKNTS